MTHINDFWLDHYCTDIAHDIAMDAQDYEQAMDWAHESADGSEYVIYTYKAHAICQNCDVENGQEFVRDCYGDSHLDYDEHASAIAYGEILARIQNALGKYFDESTGDKENV
jgi:hypothetical protein